MVFFGFGFGIFLFFVLLWLGYVLCFKNILTGMSNKTNFLTSVYQERQIVRVQNLGCFSCVPVLKRIPDRKNIDK